MNRIIIVLILSYVTGLSNAQTDIAYEVDSLVQNIVDSHDIQGLSIGVVYDGEAIFAKRYGFIKKDDSRGNIELFIMNFQME